MVIPVQEKGKKEKWIGSLLSGLGERGGGRPWRRLDHRNGLGGRGGKKTLIKVGGFRQFCGGKG